MSYPRRKLSERILLCGWLRVGVFELQDGTQERFIWLRIPSYGMFYSINNDEMRWGQRVIVYRGRTGFQMWTYHKHSSPDVGRSV